MGGVSHVKPGSITFQTSGQSAKTLGRGVNFKKTGRLVNREQIVTRSKWRSRQEPVRLGSKS